MEVSGVVSTSAIVPVKSLGKYGHKPVLAVYGTLRIAAIVLPVFPVIGTGEVPLL